MRPLVSIITPTYNSEKFIRETIDSILAQSYKNWELILIDDSSTDDTLRIIKSYIKNNFNISLIKTYLQLSDKKLNFLLLHNNKNDTNKIIGYRYSILSIEELIYITLIICFIVIRFGKTLSKCLG